MRTAAFAGLVAGTTVLLALSAASQSTTAPQPAPSIPPGETPPEAARDPQGTDVSAPPGKSDPEQPEQPAQPDPPRSRSR